MPATIRSRKSRKAVIEDVFSDPAELDDLAAQGVIPTEATEAKPGSEDKVKILTARYAAGLPLWHNDDCADHAIGLEGLFSDLSDSEASEEEE